MKKKLSQPRLIALLVLGISVTALAGAFIAQYAFGLYPCKLCIYQRWPFVVTGLAGIALFFFSNALKKAAYLEFIAGIVFLANAALALFHSGVERKYWEGLEGCGAPDMTGSVAEILERIKNAPVARCDEIPWADPLFGLSMANYNVLLCLLSFLLCITASLYTMRKANGYLN